MYYCLITHMHIQIIVKFAEQSHALARLFYQLMLSLLAPRFSVVKMW
jgi:hypothetical protein